MNHTLALALATSMLTACSTGGAGPSPADPAMSAVEQRQDGAVRFDPPVLDFGVVAEDNCKPHKVAAINQSGGPIASPGFRLDADHAFAIQEHFRHCPDPLPVGEVCSIYVNFCPRSHDTHHGTLAFTPTGETAQVIGKGRVRAF